MKRLICGKPSEEDEKTSAEWKNIFAYRMSYKGLVLEYIKNSQNTVKASNLVPGIENKLNEWAMERQSEN